MSNAQAQKEKGNDAFKNGKYADAVGFYSAAIIADRKEPTYPLNRAAAYLKLGKYEDAERDCTTVLTLKPNHPKALFRRGQARMGLEHLEDARKDLAAALALAPQDKDIAKVLEEVDSKLSAKAKKTASARGANDTSTPRRRRVPIEIVDSDSSPAPSTSKLSSSTDADLKPVSSRTLTTSTTKPSPTLVPPPSSTKTETPKPSPSPAPSPFKRVEVNPTSNPQPSSFKEAKQTRDNVRPSRVGGGIFRPNGESKLFQTREITPSAPEAPAQAQEPAPKPQVKAPASFSDLVKRWTSLKTPEERWALLSTIPPSQFPSFCKSAMEPTFLASIFQTIYAVLDKADLNTQISIRSFLEYLPLVPRFNTIFLFLSKAEKEVAIGIWSRLEVEAEDLEGVWAALLKPMSRAS
ncbi:hypothetical protein NMY22_g8111 [Coprinellus aureogranulatus]|nr:hypothetical protein NMY22_g8111 [Coprinellus aureogranulatus]